MKTTLHIEYRVYSRSDVAEVFGCACISIPGAGKVLDVGSRICHT